MTPAARAFIGKIVARYPGEAAAVHAQVIRLLAAVLPTGDDAIATAEQLDALLESVVARGVVGKGRPSTMMLPTETDEFQCRRI